MFSLKASISRYQNVMKLPVQKSSQNVNMTNDFVIRDFQKKTVQSETPCTKVDQKYALKNDHT